MLKACVFCSANDGLAPEILAQVAPFCDGLRDRGGSLLYGGGRAGLMGAFADQALARGLVVRGAITQRLNLGHEVGHKGLHELLIVPDLFARKRWFIDQSDVFFVFPGGLGTLDEALEILTWRSLGETDKPLVFVNIDGFWDSTFASFRDLETRRVLRPGTLEKIDVVTTSREAWTRADGLLAGRIPGRVK